MRDEEFCSHKDWAVEMVSDHNIREIQVVTEAYAELYRLRNVQGISACVAKRGYGHSFDVVFPIYW